MTQETIEKLPLFLSFDDLRGMGFTKGMIQNVIYKSNETGVIMVKKKRMVIRDDLLKWIDKQRINVEDCSEKPSKETEE